MKRRRDDPRHLVDLKQFDAVVRFPFERLRAEQRKIQALAAMAEHMIDDPTVARFCKALAEHMGIVTNECVSVAHQVMQLHDARRRRLDREERLVDDPEHRKTRPP